MAYLSARADDSIDRAMVEIGEVAAVLAQCGFHNALAGNISVRVGHDRVICTKHAADKRNLRASDFVLCDMEGRKVSGAASPTSEILMHVAVYKGRPDVNSVIHAHPPTATAFAAASIPLTGLVLPELVVLLGPIALVPYVTPGTADLGKSLEPYLQHHQGFLLENHGALSVGKNLRQAGQRMELIEEYARVSVVVRQIGKPFALSSSQEEALSDLRQRLLRSE
jgi:L-fuculose-phosphate aldolase